MSKAGTASLRIAVVGGGPAGSFFALYALEYARRAGRDLAVTIYEGKDFRRFGLAGCNMCAGIIPVSVLAHFGELHLPIPSELVLSHINTYSLHTSAGTLTAAQPDALADLTSVYRGTGPRYGHPPGLVSFDEFLIEQAVARGARLRRAFVKEVLRGRPVEVVSGGEREPYDLVVLATGLNGHPLLLHGFDYRPPPIGSMCQTELYLGPDEVRQRLGPSVHIFLPPDDIAAYGMLIPKGPFVTVSLLSARRQMRSLRQFLELDEVVAVLGSQVRRICGCLPRISIGLAHDFIDDGFVAIGDTSATRLYKNGIGSALATAERAAWTAIHCGCTRDEFARHYLPLCRAIERDNQVGRLLFLQVPVLKRVGLLPMAHRRLAAELRRGHGPGELHTRILWGMFTGAYSYRELFRMGMNPGLVIQLLRALGSSMLEAAFTKPPSRQATLKR